MRAWLAILLFVLGAAPAGHWATLEWDASPDPSVVGYRVWFGGASRTYTNQTDAGAVLEHTVSNLLAGVTYYFAVTAYNAGGLESELSSELSYTVPVPPAPLQVVIIRAGLLWATNLAGPWWPTNGPLVLTNPTGNRFFKPAGVSIELTNL